MHFRFSVVSCIVSSALPMFCAAAPQAISPAVVSNPAAQGFDAPRIRLNAVTSSVVVSASANPAGYGKPVTLTATVTPSAATGKVTFYDALTPIGFANVASGVASFTTISLSPGHRSITARYNGDSNDNASLSAAFVLTVQDSAVLSTALKVQLQSGEIPSFVLTGDFNNDGKLDIIALSQDYFGDGFVEYLAGNGNGSFAPAVQITADSEPFWAVAGDFNGDGNLDLAVTAVNSTGSPTEIDIFLGNGNGTFQPYVAYPVVPTVAGDLIESLGISTADFNRDGILDLVVANGNDNSVTVFLGNGNGTFHPGTTIPVCTNCSSNTPTGESPTTVAVGDFNGDGVPDIATANQLDGSVSILIGNGTGGFTLQTQSPFYIGDSAYGIVTFDTNGDGILDLIVSDPADSQVVVVAGNGNGTFSNSPATYDVGYLPAGLTVGDFNGDLVPDVLVVNSVDETYNVLDGIITGGFNITGPFGPPCGAGDCTWAQPAVGDFNGDSITDVVIADQGDLLPPPDAYPGVLDLFMGQGCAYNLSQTSISFDDQGGTVPIYISAGASNCNWTASSTTSWVALTPTTGIANQTALTAIVQPNTTGVERTTTVTIAGQSVPVTSWATKEVFVDVAPSNPFFDAIDLFYASGVTAGCSVTPLDYCPNQNVTRSEMAVFIIKAIYGNTPYTLNQQTPYFLDVPEGSFAYTQIQKMYELGITAGCGNNDYCPDENVTRAQMAIFIIKMRYEQVTFTFSPTPYFTDVPPTGFAFEYIQRMAQDGITSGCGNSQYCPNTNVSRGQMAVFIEHAAFNALYPPGTPVITSIAPNTIAPGGSGTFTVTGLNTAFVNGTTQLLPPYGFTISNLNVTSPTSFTVTLSAASTVSVQPESIVVETAAQQAILPNGLIIQ